MIFELILNVSHNLNQEGLILVITRRDGLSHHFKTIRLFLGAAVDEKTAAQKPEKGQNFGYPLSVFFK